MSLIGSSGCLPVQSGEILLTEAPIIVSFLLSFRSLRLSLSWTNIIQITKTSYQMEKRDGWHVVHPPGLCVCVCSSSFWLCVCSDWALSAGMEDVQSWVEVASLGPRAPSQHRVLVQAFLPPLLPVDRQPSRSHKAGEDQASSFACRSGLLPWRIYKLTVWTAWLWTVPWLFCWTSGIFWASYLQEGQCIPPAGKVLDDVLGTNWGYLVEDWPGLLGRRGGLVVADTVSCRVKRKP